jgi:membrane associated rhomboid family serine protease
MFARTENWRQFLARYPLLSLIIAVNAVVMAYTYLRFGSNQSQAVYEFGGLLPDSIESGEPWRFVTYAFLHAGMMHFIMNMAFLLIVAPPLEYMLGRTRLFVLFALSVLGTSGLVYAAGNQAGVGVSGFCYGVLGTLAVLALRRKDLLDRTSAQVVWSWIGVGWVGTLLIPGISAYGHLGGFVAGLLFGLVAVRPSARLTPWVPVPWKRRVTEAGQQGQGQSSPGQNEAGNPSQPEERRHDRP